MTREKSGPDATPCIGLDLGYPIVDQPSGSHLQTNPSKERIRQRAHEIGRARAAQAILRSTGTERSMSWLQHSGGNPSRSGGAMADCDCSRMNEADLQPFATALQFP
jgi:hypothetical protein